MRDGLNQAIDRAAGLSVTGLFVCSVFIAIELASIARAQWVGTHWLKRQTVALETACEEHAP